MNSARVLVVDDNRDMVAGIAMLLGEVPLDVRTAHSAEGALALLEAGAFELVLTDVRMPVMSGVELLKSIKVRWPLTKVVLLTAHGTIDAAVDAMKSGACDYLTKPFDNDALLDVVKRALGGGPSACGFDIGTIVGNVAAAVSANDLLPGLKDVLTLLLGATGADDGEIFLCEPEGRDPLLCVWAGADGDVLFDRARFGSNVGYPGIVAATSKPLCAKGGLGSDSRFLRQAVTNAGIRSLAAAPLPDARGALGSIHLMSRRDDFPVERVLGLLERVAVPISNAVRAWLAELRLSVDAAGRLDDSSSTALRALLESMKQVAGAQYGTLALVDPRTGRPDRVVSTGPSSLVCSHAEAGSWSSCPSVIEHGLVANPGRRQWPEACRRGLPPRAASPCCLPIIASGRLHGIVVLDFGREGTPHATGRLVPLLTMAQQTAMRLEAHHPGIVINAPVSGDVAGVHAPAAPELELRCLGPFALYRGGSLISAEDFTRSKAIVLLKLLALKAGTPLCRDVLIEHLWPGADPRHGANRLHGIVHALRSVIDPQRTDRQWLYVRNRGELYYLDTQAPIDIDLVRYRSLLTRSQRANAREAVALLEEAVELYRGDLFEDDPFAEWCEAERRDLRDRHVAALFHLSRLHREHGSDEKALTYLGRASRLAPLREDLLTTQMELLVQLARPNEALSAYHEFRRALDAELGAEPSADLQALCRRLLGATRGPSRPSRAS